MGGIRARRKNKSKSKNKRDGEWVPGMGYKDIIRENEKFEVFYKAQNICETDEEFDKMMSTFKRDLPASFRVTGFRSQALAIRNLIENKYLKELAQAEDNDAEVKVEPKCLSWYPDRMAWQLNLTRKDIRRVESYFKLHNFLVSETESGNISRQEAVSMIPPIVLQVKSHHKVLDMCAAPGSKTAQLIEAIHADSEGTIPSGLVMANDSDNSRCYLLVHQAKRLQSPNVIITNHDASNFPSIFTTDESGTRTKMKFDRILCDVPCSGDGTMRKNPDIWPKWNGLNSCNLHGIQYRIAKRGLELLEVGGRLVYSTCSLHPVEDEAVIQRLLKEAGPGLELVEASSLLPGLVYKKGLKKWSLVNKETEIYKSHEEVPEALRHTIKAHMFSEERDEYNLERCIRVLPHQQDTSGFFIAVLQKSAPCAWENQKQYEKGEEAKENQENGNGTKRKSDDEEPSDRPKKKSKMQERYQGFREDPFIFLDETDDHLKEVLEYFKIKDLDPKMFFTRSKTAAIKNSLYFSTLLIRNILESNKDVKIINTGVKGFAKCENKGATCFMRLAQEGSLMTLPFVRAMIIKPTLKDLIILLDRNDEDMPPQLAELESSTQQQLDSITTGSVALIYDGKHPDGFDLDVKLVGWKGKSSLRAYVPKNERVHYLRLIGGDTSKYEKNKFQERRDKEKEESSQASDSKNEEGAEDSNL